METINPSPRFIRLPKIECDGRIVGAKLSGRFVVHRLYENDDIAVFWDSDKCFHAHMPIKCSNHK